MTPRTKPFSVRYSEGLLQQTIAIVWGQIISLVLYSALLRNHSCLRNGPSRLLVSPYPDKSQHVDYPRRVTD